MSAPSRPPARPATGGEPAPSAEALARSLVGLAARLVEVMIRETALVACGRTGDVAALAQEKIDLSRAYAGRWAQLKADRAGAAALPPSLLQALRAQIERLAAAATENEKTLRLMRHAAERVLDIVMRAIRQQHGAALAYANPRMRPLRRQPGLLGVSLNRSL
jgi:hypothetical protein